MVEETPGLLEGLNTTSIRIATLYLDYIIYFYFLISLIVFFFVARLRTEPFNKSLVKYITLTIISTIGLLLFFKEYLYILYLVIAIILFLILKVRTEIRQFFLVLNYKRKELKIDLWELEKLSAALEKADNIYSRFSFVSFFVEANKSFNKNMTLLIYVNDKVFPIFLYLTFFSFFVLIILFYALGLIYETQYLLFDN